MMGGGEARGGFIDEQIEDVVISMEDIKYMAKIVQSLTRASDEYNADVAHSLVRDLDAVLEKLNSTFQEELKQEIEARSFFLD